MYERTDKLCRHIYGIALEELARSGRTGGSADDLMSTRRFILNCRASDGQRAGTWDEPSHEDD
jgi:hypothetical protein